MNALINRLSLHCFQKLNRSLPTTAIIQRKRYAQDNKNKGKTITMMDLKNKMKEEEAMILDLNVAGSDANMKKRMQYLPKAQSDLPTRNMKDSFLEALIPLSTDLELQDKYISFLKQVRIGRLLEDVDHFAVMVAYTHLHNPKLPKEVPCPHMFVTLMVDRIDFTEYIPTGKEDIKISGHVSWVGKTSLEIVIWLEQLHAGTWMKITKALFLMASRSPDYTNSAIVNPLTPDGEREKAIFAGGESRKKRRLNLMARDVAISIPNQQEQETVHDLYTRTRELRGSLHAVNLPPGAVWMSDAVLFNTILSQPENRNMHNTIFGGFLMRQAIEFAFVLAYDFSKHRAKVEHISDIIFLKPIAISSLIRMYAHVIYTKQNYVQIIVYTEVYNTNTNKSETATTFNITYRSPEAVSEVVPKTYHEAMMYIDGMRHYNEAVGGKEVLKDVEIIGSNRDKPKP